MPHDSLNLMQEKYLRLVLAEGHAFEERFGKVARRFFERLPMLFGLFRRVSFDLSLPAHERRLAAAALVYLAEPDDFLRESAAVGVSSYIDDVWVAFEVFRRLRDAVGDDAIARHIRSPGQFDELATLAENSDTMREHVPSKVLEQLLAFIDG